MNDQTPKDGSSRVLSLVWYSRRYLSGSVVDCNDKICQSGHLQQLTIE